MNTPANKIRSLMEALNEDDYDAPGTFTDPDDAEFDRQQALKEKIEGHIRQAFNTIGVEVDTLNRTSVWFDVEDREASVKLDDTSVSLKQLAGLLNSGLADDYIIHSYTDSLEIEFIVSPDMDNAV